VYSEGLRDVLAAGGPFASVHFDASHDTEDAAKELELRWRAVRERLAALDTPRETVRALEEAVAERRPAVGRVGRFLVAAGDRVLVDEYLTAPPAEPEVRLSRVPYLIPLVEAGQPAVPYVMVRVDKKGARMWAVGGEQAAQREVHGRAHPVHKVRSGGWSHRRMQSRTEEIVKHNVDEVAGELTRLVGETSARLVVLTGEVEARALLCRELPAAIARMAVETDHEQDAERLAAQVWHAEQGADLDRFRSELGRDNRAVQGIPDTTAALREGNVELLVINTGALRGHQVWVASQPNLVAADRAALHELGVSDRARIPADEALPAAALAVAADVRTTDEDLPAEGAGALLRHT
jgi:hypothetical protein